MPISNLLVNPNPVNSPFHLSGGALILVFSITPSELVVMGHGLRYQKAVSEYSGCNLPALPSTEEQYKNIMQTLLLTSLRSSQREMSPVPHPHMQSKQECRLYFFYWHLSVHLMWVTPSAHNSVGKSRFISLYLKHGASPIIHQAMIKGSKSYSEKIIKDNDLFLVNPN